MLTFVVTTKNHRILLVAFHVKMSSKTAVSQDGRGEFFFLTPPLLLPDREVFSVPSEKNKRTFPSSITPVGRFVGG